MPNDAPAAALPLGLFLTASIVTFGCLVIMQFLDPPVFFVVLVAMHIGIVLFIASRRTFRARGIDMGRYFKREYLMLVPFLLLMFYSFAVSAGIAPQLGMAKAALVIVYATICFAVAFLNFRRMQHELEG